MDWINYQHLVYFREIAITGSIANASKNLRISSPALSSQLKTLEEHLGSELFIRKGRQLVITELGKDVLKYADRVFQTGKELTSFINNESHRQRIKLKLGFSDELPKVLATRISNIVFKKFDCELTIIEGTHQSLSKKLINHEIEIFFSNRKTFSIENEFTSASFLKEKISIYGAKNFKLLKKDFPNSIQGANFILPTIHSDIRQSIDNWFIKNNISYKLKAEVQDSSVKKELASAGIGLVPISEIGAQSLVKEEKLFFIGNLKNINEEFFYTIKKDKVLESPIVQFILDALKTLKS